MCRLKGHLSIIDNQRKSKVTIKLPNKDDIRENYLNFMERLIFFQSCAESITEIIRQTIILIKRRGEKYTAEMLSWIKNNIFAFLYR